MACVRLSGMTGLVRKFRNSMGWVAQVRLRDVIALVQRYWRRSKQRPHLSSIWEGGGVHDASSEANFKTKASKQGPTSIGGRWIVIVTRKRRVRSPEWAGRHANLKVRR